MLKYFLSIIQEEKMIQEFLIIFIINYIGVLMAEVLKFPLPGTINGMLLLFVMLYFKVIKLEKIEKASDFLLVNMTIFFMPPSVKLIESLYLLKTGIFKIIFILIFTTILTMIVTGLTVQYMIERKEKKYGKLN